MGGIVSRTPSTYSNDWDEEYDIEEKEKESRQGSIEVPGIILSMSLSPLFSLRHKLKNAL